MREWLHISTADYHALPAFGSGAIRCFSMDGPLEFWARYISRTKVKDETDPMRLGRAFHAAMETGDWQSGYWPIPTVIQDDAYASEINAAMEGRKSQGARLNPGDEINTRLPAHRLYLAAHETQAQTRGLDFLTEAEIESVKRQVQACYDHAGIADLLQHKSSLNVEATCVLQHSSGLKLKALCDLVLTNGILDFKTTGQRNNFSFLRDAFRKGYDFQAGQYSVVTGKEQFWFASVTSEPPFEANLFEVPPSLLLQRAEDVNRQTEVIAQTMRMSALDDKDSQGIPASWHSEGWNTALEFSLDGPWGDAA